MPNSCSVPECKSNYNLGDHVLIFKMPLSPPTLNHVWACAFRREDIGDVEVVYICINHFQKEDIDHTFKIPKGDCAFTEVSQS